MKKKPEPMDFLWTNGTTHTPGEPLREDVHTEV